MVHVDLTGIFLPLETWGSGLIGELSDESLLQQLVDNATGDERVFGCFVEFSDGEVLFIEQSGEDVFVEGKAIGGGLCFHGAGVADVSMWLAKRARTQRRGYPLLTEGGNG